MIATFAALLTQAQVERVHEASLEILETVGLLVRNEKAREYFARHGCPVDPETEIVKLPRAIVEECRRAYPSKFTFHGRDPQYDKTLPDDAPVVVTASSAPNMLDPVTGEERRAYSDDIARIARLIHELPGYDVFSISTLAEDTPPDQYSITRLYPTVKNCLKPIRCSALNHEDADAILRLGALIAGSEDAYRAHPFFTHHYCPVVSPLAMDFDSTEMLMYFTEKGYPNFGSIVPNAGMSSPLTLLGTLAQGNAEFLAWSVLQQMIRPGAPLIYSFLSTVADMRRGAYAPGGVECAMLSLGHAQMARFYNVPNGGYIGQTNAKINDAQSGYETGMGALAGLLGGMDMFNLGGLLDALMCFDFAKAVIDDEIALMLKRLKRGFALGEKDFALDEIAETGPGGTFLDKPRTYELMKITGFLPDIADRDPRIRWTNRGALDTQTRAMNKVRDLLTRNYTSFISPDVDAHIRAEWEGLVSGELTTPAGWEQAAEAAPAMA